MIKKLFLTALVTTTIGSLNAQNLRAKTKLQLRTIDENAVNMITTNTNNSNNQDLRTSTIASYGDTLWYFYNKQKYRNTAANQSFYVIQSAVSTSTDGDLTEFGSSFLNGASIISGAPVTVKGAFLLVSRQPNSNPAGIPIKMYLYNATPAGMPTTKVDSALATITNTNGVFSYVAFTNPKTVTGSFFISYKNMAITATDTLLAWLNSANTATSSAAANTKFGEGLAYTRFVDPSTDVLFPNTDAYGTGTDLETIVVPAVSFSINANYTLTTVPNSTNPVGAYCLGTPITFSNTTDPASLMYNRQFNFNKFIPYWAPFSNTLTPNPADSITTWSFPAGPNVYTQNAIVTPGAVSNNFTATLTMKYRPSPRITAQRPSVSDIKTGSTQTIVACGSVGIPTVVGFEGFNLYPNPAINGKAQLTGLVGSNTITVYNMLGQLAISQVTNNESASLDLSGQPTGSYFVRITNSDNVTKTVKIINQ